MFRSALYLSNWTLLALIWLYLLLSRNISGWFTPIIKITWPILGSVRRSISQALLSRYSMRSRFHTVLLLSPLLFAVRSHGRVLLSSTICGVHSLVRLLLSPFVYTVRSHVVLLQTFFLYAVHSHGRVLSLILYAVRSRVRVLLSEFSTRSIFIFEYRLWFSTRYVLN